MNESPKTSRSQGVTPAERYLKKLCDRTFLSMWSYASVFNNKSTGQEVCDLLVVFGNHIIIFSDKDCAFPNTGNLELDWKRWYKKAIRESANQIFGAERWILKHPDRLFLDQACKIPFPINLPPKENTIIHRIVVAHSASKICKKLLGGSGSLMIKTDVIGDSEVFTIGRIDASNRYVHVFDDTTLDILLRSLDTIFDFTSYLKKKEKFLTSKKGIASTGEEELLAFYLTKVNENGEHDFIFNEKIEQVDLLALADEGSWESFSRNPQRIVQVNANRISYFWDNLIEIFTKSVTARESLNHQRNPVKIPEAEPTLRFMASESRTRRRSLASLFLELLSKTPDGLKGSRTVAPVNSEGPCYVFLALPYHENTEYEKYRLARAIILEKFCFLAKLRFPNAKHIIGIATETGRLKRKGGSEDTIYLDATQWTSIHETEALQAEKELRDLDFVGDYKMVHRHEEEYPYSEKQINDFQKSKGNIKNLSCPCGSGRKFKKCCANLN